MKNYDAIATELGKVLETYREGAAPAMFLVSDSPNTVRRVTQENWCAALRDVAGGETSLSLMISCYVSDNTEQPTVLATIEEERTARRRRRPKCGR